MPRRSLLGFVLLCATACGPHRVETIPVESLRCIDRSDTRVIWDRPALNRRNLDRWCASVGPPVVIPSAASTGKQIARLVVISWNVHVGGGRLQELADLIRTRTAEMGGEVGVVLLLQEVFRGGEAVGAPVPDGLRVPAAIRPHRPVEDIAQVAAKLGMSAFYVPSMRNGRSISLYEQEDRGSAILSTEPLSDLTAIELPFARQRRVAVMATVTPRRSGAESMQVVAGHFDVAMLGRGGLRQAEHLAGRLPGHNPKQLPVIVGLDANAMRGFKDGTVKAMARLAPVLKRCGTGRTAAWLARLDFVFSDLPESVVAHCETLHGRYGSDHRPILLRIDYE